MAALLLSRAEAIELPEGYQLQWADEFNAPQINTTIWENLDRRDSYNQELQYYTPDQASTTQVNDPQSGEARDVLRITATNQPLDGKPYRSSRLESRTDTGYTVQYGRVEVLARIPTTKGLWPAIWLFPNRGTPWPTGGEIDIMEHKGSQPTVVSSAYHYNSVPNTSTFRYHEHDLDGITGQQISWPDGFHEYAVEWDPHEIRFYVDGYNHFTVVDNNAPTLYKPDLGVAQRVQRHVVPSTPMNVILNAAVGGFFDGNPDGSTIFPQHMDVDYVRVFQRSDNLPRLQNSSFEDAASGWSLSGDAEVNQSVLLIDGNGVAQQQLYGPFNEEFELHISLDAVSGLAVGEVDLDYYNQENRRVAHHEVTIEQRAANGARTLVMQTPAPQDAVYATLTVRGGAGSDLPINAIELLVAPIPGDFNGDGVVDAADYTVWRDTEGSTTNPAADGNRDGVVDQLDYEIWRDQYQGDQSSGNSSSTAVPEPTGALIVALMMPLAKAQQRSHQ